MTLPAIRSEAAAFRSKIAKIIHPARNAELVEYQKSIGKVREEYAQQFSNQLPKSKLAEALKKRKQNASKVVWTESMGKIKSKISDRFKQYGGRMAVKLHPCRPTVEHFKSPAQRNQAAKNLAAAMDKVERMRLKYTRLIEEDSRSFVTYENIDDKIAYALSHPVDHSCSIERVANKELSLRSRLFGIQIKPRGDSFASDEKEIKVSHKAEPVEQKTVPKPSVIEPWADPNVKGPSNIKFATPIQLQKPLKH